MQIFNRKNQVPILSPYNITVLDGEAAKFAWIEILVVLRMRMATDKIANINNLLGIIAERKTNCQIACILCFDDINSIHIVPPYNFFLMLVLRTLCFNTKNFTHFSIIFL